MDTPDLSAIEKDSFWGEMQLNCGKPLQSTAIDEDLNLSKEARVEQKTKSQEYRAAVDKKEMGQKISSPNNARGLILGKRKKSSNKGHQVTAPSSDRIGEYRGEGASSDEQKRRQKQGSHFEVVLDTFLDFCNNFGESSGSVSVSRSLVSFRNSVKDQLSEKILCHKALGDLKRENKKVDASICSQTSKLLDAKHELMRAERLLWTLLKEKDELEQSLADLRLSQEFLCDVKKLKDMCLHSRH